MGMATSSSSYDLLFLEEEKSANASRKSKEKAQEK
jgi:hypothetical protein